MILAEGGLVSARESAEALKGPNRDQALAGVAQAWAKSDLEGTIAWAKALPEGVDRDEIIRTALIRKAAIDPAEALELAGIVPSGGRHAYGSSTTGARILVEASKTDFDATVAWLAAHPGRFGHEDLMGISRGVTERLNANAAEFLTTHAANGSLAALLPAIGSAILNDASGQRAPVWDWRKTQPSGDAVNALKQEVLNSAGYQDPALAMRLVADLPRTADGDAQLKSLAGSLLNGGSMLHRFDKLLAEAPERLRQPLIDTAFQHLRADSLDDPQRWVARLSLLPETSRAAGTESIARAWAEQTPEEAAGWVTSLPASEGRDRAVAAIAATWAGKDARGAAQWVATMTPGTERDRSVGSLVLAVAEKYPREAWDWALSINDPSERDRAAAHAARMMAMRDPVTAGQWIDAGPFTPEAKAHLRSGLDRVRGSGELRHSPLPGR